MNLNDDYEHTDHNLVYVIENIPTKETEGDYNIAFSEGCQCKHSCTQEGNCICTIKSGSVYNYDQQTDIQSYKLEIKDIEKPIYECNSQCKCEAFCGNRLVQMGPRQNLKITSQGSKGLGLITTAKVQSGNFICEYAGEIISKEEAERRHTQNEETNCMNYIFCVRETFGANKIVTFIDPAKFGNIGRYLNHSCEPNCQLFTIRANSIVPKLCIFAKKDVKEDSELTFDYGFHDPEVKTTKKCLCDMPNCRKYLPFNKYT